MMKIKVFYRVLWHVNYNYNIIISYNFHVNYNYNIIISYNFERKAGIEEEKLFLFHILSTKFKVDKHESRQILKSKKYI